MTDPVTPTAPTAAPATIPNRAGANFSAEIYAWFNWEATVVPKVEGLATVAHTNAVAANERAVAAAASADTATTQAGLATTNGAAQVALAAAQVALAEAEADAAAASAASALNAPGTSATSTTSLTIGTGSKSITIQAGKAYAVGQSVTIASTATPTKRMSGVITSYNSGTGALAVSVDTTSGHTDTLADWTVSVGSVPVVVDVERTWTTEQTFGKAINEAHGADIASAGTINLTAATGNLVDVTGTTTITAITLADGYERTVRFTDALTLTHGVSLVLPGGSNITTAAGDFAIFRGYAAGVVRCVAYTKASGAAVVAAAGGAWTLLSSVTASGSATVDIETTFDATYDNYVIVASGLIGSSGVVTLNARMKIGGSYVATGAYQWHNQHTGTTASTYSGENGTNDTTIQLGYLDGTAGSSTNLNIFVDKPAGTSQRKLIHWAGGAVTATAGTAFYLAGVGANNSTGALTGVRIYASSGNITGAFRLYGIKNS